MPRDKDLKRLVRARMTRTGESYTAARAQIARKPTPASPQSSNYAERAGMSDERVKASTGCDWTKWVYALDRQGAASMSHREIAELVKGKYGVPDWWSQTVTVGYERIKGLRARGQRRDGSYEATKSRTFNVPVAVLFDAWANAKTRRRWLEEQVKVRTASPPKSMRLDWPGGGIVAVGFFPKGDGKSFVAVSHAKLPDRATADQLKALWAERLDALRDVVKPTA